MSENIDYQEVKKFTRLSDEWWNPEGPLKTLHHINHARLALIQNHIAIADMDIADIGCGGGILSESLAALEANVCGIDLSKEAISVATMHAKESVLDIDYRHCSSEQLAETNAETYDAVTCMELLEHVPDPLSLIKDCARLSRSKGYVFFSTIHRSVKAYSLAVLGAEYIMGLLPKGTHDYDKFIKPAELSTWCRKAGLTPIEFKGIFYNPLNHKACLTDDVSVNYCLVCRK